MARRKITASCEQCGATFQYRFRGRNYRSRYCSPPCRSHASGLTIRRSYLDRMADRLRIFADPTVCWDWPGKTNAYGYGLITDGARDVRAHRAAWEVMHGPIPDGMNVLHRCDRPGCINAVNHLFLGTHADNTADKVAKDRHPRGERQWHARLTEQSVREIRVATGTHTRIGEQFGVTRTTVRDIKTRRRWRHVT